MRYAAKLKYVLVVLAAGGATSNAGGAAAVRALAPDLRRVQALGAGGAITGVIVAAATAGMRVDDCSSDGCGCMWRLRGCPLVTSFAACSLLYADGISCMGRLPIVRNQATAFDAVYIVYMCRRARR